MLFANEYNLYVHYPWDRMVYLQLITDFKNKTYKTFNKFVADKAAQPTLKPGVEYNLHGCPLVLQVKDLHLQLYPCICLQYVVLKLVCAVGLGIEVFVEFSSRFGVKSSIIRQPYILNWAFQGVPLMEDLFQDIFRLRKKVGQYLCL